MDGARREETHREQGDKRDMTKREKIFGIFKEFPSSPLSL